MNAVGTGTISGAHHQAIIDEDLLSRHGIQTTIVGNLDPKTHNTLIDDVAKITLGTAGVVGAAAGMSIFVPPAPRPQIRSACLVGRSRHMLGTSSKR